MSRRHLLVLTLAGMLLPQGASAAITAEEARKIDQVFAAYTRPGSPGCAFVLAEKGKVAYSKGYGLASLEQDVAIDPSTTMLDIASVSKQFTAASILLLAKDRRLSLDDGIRKYVPELPAYADPVTIRHLLHHTSGIPDYLILTWLSGIEFEDVITQHYALSLLTRQQTLIFPPGQQFSYSNSGYVLLAMVVERVSGKPLRDFAQQQIFDPLGMKHSRFVDDYTAVIPHRASGYHRDANGGFQRGISNFGTVGDGGVWTTAEDLAKWAANFEQPKVGGSWLVEQLQVRGQFNDGTQMKYARGIRMESFGGLPMAAHTGSGGGANATLLRFPQQQFALIALCNVSDADSDALLRAVADIHIGQRPGLAASAAAPIANVDTKRYLGTYANLDQGAVVHVVARDGKLWFTAPWGEIELLPAGVDRFQMATAPLGIVTFSGLQAETRHLALRYDDTAIDMMPVAMVAPGADALGAYAGRYESEALQARWMIAVKDGQLTYQDTRRPPAPLTPLTTDVFVTPFGALLRFKRNGRDGLDGFTVLTAQTGPQWFMRTTTSSD